MHITEVKRLYDYEEDECVPIAIRVTWAADSFEADDVRGIWLESEEVMILEQLERMIEKRLLSIALDDLSRRDAAAIGGSR